MKRVKGARRCLLTAVLAAVAVCLHCAHLSSIHPAAFRSTLQRHLRHLQFPPKEDCSCRRVLLYTGNYYEGFACAVHQLGLAQLAALASDRMLVVPDKDIWGYVSSKSCKQRNWNCVFQPLSSCSEIEALKCNGKRLAVIDAHQDHSIIAGASPVVGFRPRGPSSTHGSIHERLFGANGGLAQWIEDAGGVFQLRSEIQLWQWKLQPALERFADTQVQLGPIAYPLAISTHSTVGLSWMRITHPRQNSAGGAETQRRMYLPSLSR
mmetsp:Transcript_33898/g.96033  ORF Transcript_33898/g.96033 Transcript_33898/m.96033 type:complete len:265 (+) Transcript_33898:326-1120(+)